MSYLALARRIIAASADETASGSSAPASVDPPHGLGRCFACGRELPMGVAIARCDACRGATSGRPATARPAAPYPLRVAVESDVTRAATADLASLRVVVEAYSQVWHDDRELRAATELGERIEMLLERLDAVGCAVRVEPLQ